MVFRLMPLCVGRCSSTVCLQTWTLQRQKGKQYAQKSVWLEREDLLASLQANIDALCIERSLSIVVSARLVVFTDDARCNDRFVA